MKSLAFVLIALSFSNVSFAKRSGQPKPPNFSAFANNGMLYVTILGDCNKVGGNLEVDPSCRSDRRTKNLVFTCSAKLMLEQTAMACPELPAAPKVISIDLNEEKVALEARTLKIFSGETFIEVRLK